MSIHLETKLDPHSKHKEIVSRWSEELNKLSKIVQVLEVFEEFAYKLQFKRITKVLREALEKTTMRKIERQEKKG